MKEIGREEGEGKGAGVRETENREKKDTKDTNAEKKCV